MEKKIRNLDTPPNLHKHTCAYKRMYYNTKKVPTFRLGLVRFRMGLNQRPPD